MLEERRRLARDLHDGLAQELAFISRLSRQTAPIETQASAIQAAAERALDESRRAIAALDAAAGRAARPGAGAGGGGGGRPRRAGADPGARATADLRVRRDVQEALIRVACEAVSNATRHGHAEMVRVRVEARGGLELLVLDDGIGFDTRQLDGASGRFGITAMRERIEALGG